MSISSAGQPRSSRRWIFQHYGYDPSEAMTLDLATDLKFFNGSRYCPQYGMFGIWQIFLAVTQECCSEEQHSWCWKNSRPKLKSSEQIVQSLQVQSNGNNHGQGGCGIEKIHWKMNTVLSKRGLLRLNFRFWDRPWFIVDETIHHIEAFLGSIDDGHVTSISDCNLRKFVSLSHIACNIVFLRIIL